MTGAAQKRTRGVFVLQVLEQTHNINIDATCSSPCHLFTHHHHTRHHHTGATGHLTLVGTCLCSNVSIAVTVGTKKNAVLSQQ